MAFIAEVVTRWGNKELLARLSKQVGIRVIFHVVEGDLGFNLVVDWLKNYLHLLEYC